MKGDTFRKYKTISLPLKILFLNYEFPPLGGGAGIVTQHLIEEFIRAGHSVTLITTWFAGEEEISQKGNLKIVRLKSKRQLSFQSNPREMLSWMWHALRYVKQHPELKEMNVCVTNFSIPGGPVAYLAKKFYGIPYVLLSHAHDIPWYYPDKMFLWHLLLYFPIRFFCVQSEYNVIVADEMKGPIDKLVGKKGADKNKVIYNGLHIDRFRTQFSGDVLRVLFVGRLVAQKAPFVFLNAIKLLAASNIPMEVIVLGDGDLREKMEEYILMNGLTNIDMRGKVNHLEVYKELHHSHLMLSTSENEGMSIAILEAVSTGVYVIATPASGNDSLIEENISGNIVPFGDYKSMAKEVRRFYYEKFLNNYSYPDTYLERVEKKFAWKNIALEYLELLDRSAKFTSKPVPSGSEVDERVV